MSRWVRSSRCESGTCVLVHLGAEVVSVRDAKLAAGPVLEFDRETWRAFTASLALLGEDGAE